MSNEESMIGGVSMSKEKIVSMSKEETVSNSKEGRDSDIV
jgi:hypothetical protein